MTIKKLISAIMAGAMCISAGAAVSAEAVYISVPSAPVQNVGAVVDSGTCGENLTWTLDEEGTLTISGT